MPYLAAIVTSLPMSGGVGSGRANFVAGSPTSVTKPSNPAGLVHKSIRAGDEPCQRLPVRYVPEERDRQPGRTTLQPRA